MKKEFKGLLRSEITKCERYASKITGTECEATGYSLKKVSEEHEIAVCKVEVCRRDDNELACRAILIVTMFDRRRSFVASAE